MPLGVQFLATNAHPFCRKYQYAQISPRTPVRRASSFFASLEKPSSSRKPRRAAQRTARNIKLEKIGMLPSLATHIFPAV